MSTPKKVVPPSVTIVFLVHNRRNELRESLGKMLRESDYDADRIDVIVVDNASTDDSAAMVTEEFPQVQLIRRDVNCGVSGWNAGFAAARGSYVLALDDDCYLPSDGLRRAVSAAEAAHADLISFGVTSSFDSEFRFDLGYRTGLLSFWGCAVLMRRPVLHRLEGYDPDIFVWANELEFMMRFFDCGYRHLYLPEVVAVHMKEPAEGPYVLQNAYVANTRHWAYIAAKLLRPREAMGALIALLAAHVRDAIRVDRTALRGIPHCISGFLHGLRRRRPLSNPEVSRAFRRNFESFAGPWRLTRPPKEFLRPQGDPGRRRAEFFTNRVKYYPTSAATLEF